MYPSSVILWILLEIDFSFSSWLNLILKSEGKLGGSQNAIAQIISSHQVTGIFSVLVGHNRKRKVESREFALAIL